MSVKAIVVAPIYPSPDNPQAGIFVHRQIVNLAEQGVECRVLVYRPAPPPFPRWMLRRSWLKYYWKRIGWPHESDGVKADHIFYNRRWTDGEDVVPEIAESLIRFVESERIEADVIYAHWLWTGGAAALRMRERFGWPVAAIARGSEMHDWHAAHPYCRSYVGKVLREADSVLTNCEDLRSRAEEIAPGSSMRIDVIYNGCDPGKFRPADDKSQVRQEIGFSSQQKLLLFCGDVINRKGITELTAAWSDFSSTHSDWHLVMVGRVVEKGLAEELKRPGNGRVTFTGQIPHARVVKYLQAADAYVQPSRLEGLANATMEAMAVGLPVITTDTCGQRELIEDGVNGWIVVPGDSHTLHMAMESLARDPMHARRMGEAARRTIETKFNPRKETARLAEILRKTARSRVAQQQLM
jgi:glycosyltransferase involved in cell wall biosynthesis